MKSEMGKEKKGKHVKEKGFAELDTDDWCWLLQKRMGASFLCIAVFSLLVRAAVSLHPYSGAADPPKFGDYEAQRHWMEITINLPAKEWYHNSTSNDLSYWGLDYPPLTAYQSYVHALFLKFFDPDSVALFTSRGYESYLGKLLMRWTVLSSDALVFFPAVFYFVAVYHTGGFKEAALWHIAILLLNPCLILIDHGHFQYNCISLGLTMGAVAAIISNKDLAGCFLFSLALNHKQMSAYFAPAFFGHLLGKCLRRRNPLLEVLKMGLVVIGTFTVVWWPYLHSIDAILEVFFRLVPFERGIYEDYVANFWCTTSVLIKWKALLTLKSLKLLSSIATVSTILPSMVQQIRFPSNRGFLYGLLNCSFAFYFFSFQVHEKSILLPLLPASLLAIDEPFYFGCLMHFALLSMFPLICRDKLVLAYVAMHCLFVLIMIAPDRSRTKKITRHYAVSVVFGLLFFCSIALHFVYLMINPPERYPFLFEAVIMLFCFFHFILIAFCANIKQWTLKPTKSTDKVKLY